MKNVMKKVFLVLKRLFLVLRVHIHVDAGIKDSQTEEDQSDNQKKEV